MFLLTALSALGEVIEYEVVKVPDGDTLTVLAGREQQRVRLPGIDSPR